MLLLYLQQQGVELGTKEFEGTVAGGTNDVVMLKTVGLVTMGAISVVHGAGQTTLLQQLQRAVHRGKTDALVLAFDLLMEFLGREMTLRGQKHLEDITPRFGVLEILGTEKILKNLDFILHQGFPFEQEQRQSPTPKLYRPTFPIVLTTVAKGQVTRN